MARLIDFNNVWYQEVVPRSFYSEDDLERVLTHTLPIIFPDFVTVLFKTTLIDVRNGKRNKADLAMVKKDYTEWYVVEVELGKHLYSHVEEQVSTFGNCSYNDRHAKALYKKDRSALDLIKLRNMILIVPPDFLVIVNEEKGDWIGPLKALRCKTCVFQIYHDFNGNQVYRINGEHPFVYASFCLCKYQKNIPYMVEVLDTQFLSSYNILDGAVMNIEYRGLVTQWQRIDSGGKVFLEANSSKTPLDSLTDRYRLNFNNSLMIYSFEKS